MACQHGNIVERYTTLEFTNFGTAETLESFETGAPGQRSESRVLDPNLADVEQPSFPIVHVSGSSYDIGYVIGKQFRDLISNRYRKDEKLYDILIPYANTEDGQAAVDRFASENRARYPRYWDELEGLSAGSGVPFQEVLLMNIWKELSLLLPPPEAKVLSEEPDHCSVVLLCNKRVAVVGHNEDAAASVRGHVYLVCATLPDNTSFTAFTYAGELCCPAFGCNSHGVAFSLNAVNPTDVQTSGIARNFVSRDLLEAQSLEDAVQKLTSAPVAVGHHYNLMDFNQRRIVSVETASDGRHSVLEIEGHPYFHSNHYLRLSLPQRLPPTTVRRLARAKKLQAPTCVQDVLDVLGDHADTECPIYMTGPSLVTLCTALFDLDHRTVTILEGNPAKMHVVWKQRI